MLLEKLKKFNIYLASQSPRRHKLLEQMGISFNIATNVAITETYPYSLHAEEIAMYLAEKKSDAYKHLLKDNRILISADTIVWHGNNVLSKPQNQAEAYKMLNLLSNNWHEVITGVTIRSLEKVKTFFCSTKVWFRTISKEEIDYYIQNFKPFDKAGAYGIQEWIGITAIEKIEGSYFNVMGLPTQKLYVELDKFID